MPEFKEDLIQFIWQHRLFKPGNHLSCTGSDVEIIKTGEKNSDSGPDFFNAQVRVNGQLLVGNVEIHIRTSDWLKHGHANDRAYDNIILHVVYINDANLAQNKDNNVEVLELQDLIDPATINNYKRLASAPEKLACANLLKDVSHLKFTSWMDRMTIERLEDKTGRIKSIFDSNNGDYIQTFYTLLLRNFGFKVNALPFELLAKQLPVTILLKHSDQPSHLEALVLGMAGMLDEQLSDPYMLRIQNEFEFFRKKYGLVPLKKELFKFSRLRPANFPGLRLAQFAALVAKHRNLFSIPSVPTGVQDLKDILKVELQGYWRIHYNMEGDGTKRSSSMGEESIENILINTFAPFYFFFSKKTGNPKYSDLAVEILESCASENNVKVRLFSAKKQQLDTAASSQAAINLYDNYCSSKKCLNCGIGAAVLAGS